MWFVKLPLRFLLRQINWVVRLLAFGVASLTFKIIQDLSVIQLPGMESPYEIGAVDPYVASVVVYIVISRSLRKLKSAIFVYVGQGFDRLRRGD